jgi:hypothetical protein
MNFYTYVHMRADDGKVFYVGKGTGRRAWRTEKRSSFWKNMAKKHGHSVHVCMRFALEADAFIHEQFLIQCFRDTHAPLVNLTNGGEGSAGHRPTAETLALRSAAMLGKRPSVKTRSKMSVAATGRKMSTAAIEKSRQANLGRKLTPEHVAKVSAALIGRAQAPEVVAQRAAVLRGKKRDAAFCAHMSEVQRGRTLSAEHVAKVAAANTGKKRSPEATARIWEGRRAAALARAANV